MALNVEIIRHPRRRSLTLEVTRDGRVIARAPQYMSKTEIARHIEENRPWIEKKLAEAEQRRQDPNVQLSPKWPLPKEEFDALLEEAREVIPARVAYYAPIVGVTYGRITLRNQKTRWGSCSAKGNLNFNVALMQKPREALDYVVVHELCHRLEMNHSPRFWAQVERVLPDWRGRKALLDDR